MDNIEKEIFKRINKKKKELNRWLTVEEIQSIIDATLGSK